MALYVLSITQHPPTHPAHNARPWVNILHGKLNFNPKFQTTSVVQRPSSKPNAPPTQFRRPLSKSNPRLAHYGISSVCPLSMVLTSSLILAAPCSTRLTWFRALVGPWRRWSTETSVNERMKVVANTAAVEKERGCIIAGMVDWPWGV